MATFSKSILSGSTDGRGIHIDDDATPGKLIHTGPTNTAHLHEIWIYAQNYDTTDRKLTIEWGGTTAGGDVIEYTVKAENGLYLIVPGLLIKGNATALVVRAFAATTSSINIFGYVNVIA